jgi:hypothetical protein
MYSYKISLLPIVSRYFQLYDFFVRLSGFFFELAAQVAQVAFGKSAVGGYLHHIYHRDVILLNGFEQFNLGLAGHCEIIFCDREISVKSCITTYQNLAFISFNPSTNCSVVHIKIIRYRRHGVISC